MDVTNYIYTRPEHTHQDLLSEQDIKDKLKDYKLITNINVIPLNTHIRYFTYNLKLKNKIFRLGGFLQKIDQQNRYIILTNGKLKWSVQLLQSTLYQKMTEEEFKDKLVSEIKLDMVKEGSSSEIKKLKEKIDNLTNKLINYDKLEENYNELTIKYTDLYSKYNKLIKK